MVCKKTLCSCCYGLRSFDRTNRTAGGLRRKRDYTPLSWEDYFDSSRDVCVNDKNVSFVSLSASVMREGEIPLNSIPTLITSAVIV